MLRKDVKLGFAIGGVMLAVLVVYVLVVPSSDKKTAQLVVDDNAQNVVTGKMPTDTPTPTDTARPAGPTVADKTNAPPVITTAIVPDAAAPTTLPSSNVAKTNSGDLWETTLSTGKLPPTMMSVTPTPESKVDHSDVTPPSADKAADVVAGDKSAAAVDDKASTPLATAGTNTPASDASGARTHIVQSGETLSSIATAVYGDARQWKQIADANPKVNPNRLKLGTTLTLPDASKGSAKSDADKPSGGSPAPSANLDPQTQYQVQSNDSLYRISMKLYGNGDEVNKLYDTNKSVIGDNPARLKLHMVLKLPSPPTAGLEKTASR